MSNRFVALLAVLALVSAGSAAWCTRRVAAARAGAGAAAWELGNESVHLLRRDGTSVLDVRAGSAELGGASVVERGADGNAEFEHGPATTASIFDSRAPDGSATPLQIGLADGQDLTALLVSAPAGQTHDVQSWLLGRQAPTGIGPLGRLRLNGVILLALQRRRGIVLAAILPDGSVQTLAPAGSG
jgi:hypothetical protein